ncbi:hypothetical protein [Brumimicrobium aurantiacum]|uniref:Uncharacterized protein n=1 Tax=Brumimicrobium aurantiacum TaxID=1737063 RepID=A0A3E1EYG6_9FLAO|nr:hypothetical protein [Brumimicrobium aurantiacum]RFC54605.1 hypothetical protein DXU93_06345 [Brumimicrobium aurantiacum]
MEAKNIKSLNSAVYVMRHFVELSARLLPIYEKITRNEPHSVHSEEDKKKIDIVYETYNVNPRTSEFLLGSNIVALIKKTYDVLKNRSQQNEKLAQEQLEAFQEEYAKLKQDWYITLMN